MNVLLSIRIMVPVARLIPVPRAGQRLGVNLLIMRNPLVIQLMRVMLKFRLLILLVLFISSLVKVSSVLLEPFLIRRGHWRVPSILMTPRMIPFRCP